MAAHHPPRLLGFRAAMQSSAADLTASSGKVRYSAVSVDKATFKAGIAASVHRWFRLTPSFGPDLVREMLEVLDAGPEDAVLDPFAGAGTTLIEAQLEDRPSFGFELNPLLHFVGATSTNWNLDPDVVAADLESVRENFEEITAEQPTLDELGTPPIHNPSRWWRMDVLIELVVLKRAIDLAATSEERRSFLRLALAGVLVPDLTNVTLGRLQLHFIDRTSDEIAVWPTYENHANAMIDDLRSLFPKLPQNPARIWHTDATEPQHTIAPNSISCVVTSPPYPNRYSYVWNTRPHLYLLDFLTTKTEAGDLDKAAIGGTWGVATSVLAKGIVEPEHEVLDKVVGAVVSEIRASDNLMANYVMKYFNMLTTQILAMRNVLTPDARLAYVVGCSRIKGVFIETDVLLGDILAGIDGGFEIRDIHRLRKRNSGKDLHESIVYAAR